MASIMLFLAYFVYAFCLFMLAFMGVKSFLQVSRMIRGEAFNPFFLQPIWLLVAVLLFCVPGSYIGAYIRENGNEIATLVIQVSVVAVAGIFWF